MFKKGETICIEFDGDAEEAIVKAVYSRGRYLVLVERKVCEKGQMMVSADKTYKDRLEYYCKRLEDLNKRLEL